MSRQRQARATIAICFNGRLGRWSPFAEAFDQAEHLAAFDREFMEFVTRSNRVTTGDRIELPYEYLLVVGRRR